MHADTSPDSFGTFLETLQGPPSSSALLRLLAPLDEEVPTSLPEALALSALPLPEFGRALATATHEGLVERASADGIETVRLSDAGLVVAKLARKGFS